MNWLDAIIILVLIVSGVSGLSRGLVKSVLGLAGLVVGIFLAGRLYKPLAPKLTFIDNDTLAQFVAFAIVFVVVLVAASIAGSIAARILRLTMLGWLDRVGGLVFGALLGAVSLGAILTLAAKFSPVSLEATLKGSLLAAVLVKYFPLVLGLLPSDFESVRRLFR